MFELRISPNYFKANIRHSFCKEPLNFIRVKQQKIKFCLCVCVVKGVVSGIQVLQPVKLKVISIAVEVLCRKPQREQTECKQTEVLERILVAHHM